MKAIVIGLGNPILGDDGVGWKVAEEVKRRIGGQANIEVDCVSLGGISLMERLIGYDYAILVDAFRSEEASGSVLVMNLDDMPSYSAFHTTNVHDVSLQNALQVGKKLGAKLPKHIMVVGITTEETFEFNEELTPDVRAAVPNALQAILGLLSTLTPSPLETASQTVEHTAR
jgi:hydrogenase maturation protease